MPQLMVMVEMEELRLSADGSHGVLVYKCKGAGYTAAWQRKIYFTLYFRETSASRTWSLRCRGVA